MSLVGLNPRESCISSADCVELSSAPELSVACERRGAGRPLAGLVAGQAEDTTQYCIVLKLRVIRSKFCIHTLYILL